MASFALRSGGAATRSLAVASDDGRDLSAEIAVWQVVAVLAFVALAAYLVGGMVLFVWFHQRQRSKDSSSRGGADIAWGDDPERGFSCDALKSLKWSDDKRSATMHTSDGDVRDILRELFEEEVARGLDTSCFADRLERLERRIEAAGASRATGAAELHERLDRLQRQLLNDGTPMTREGASLILPIRVKLTQSEKPGTIEAAAPTTPPPMLSTLVPLAHRNAETMTEPQDDHGSSESLGCTSGSVRGSITSKSQMPASTSKMKDFLASSQRALYDKDTQTSALTRELRQKQRSLWQQTLNDKTAARKLKELLCNTKFAPTASVSHAAEIQELQKDIADLSSRLADAKAAEWQWSTIVCRQRAYFSQSERAAQEGLTILSKHPAGEIFIGSALEESNKSPRSRACREAKNRRYTSAHAADEDFDDEEMLVYENDDAEDDNSLFDHEDFDTCHSPREGECDGDDTSNRRARMSSRSL
eukprot:TRINITY_DN38255_c0_g1_i1.p1 TRINITY_DN38255_c0_g1~~TRINITY_DN38255_c0_g1_i1.p1  ORF type:complete len:476 (+),score=81.67 TRINITY_DN38255_c0_g1_i1:256-1683(+)